MFCRKLGYRIAGVMLGFSLAVFLVYLSVIVGL